jgi:uncharacterized phiE125 gp8 family phage protein
MQVRIKASQTLTEPVTVAEFKIFNGYAGTDQDTFIGTLITAARELLESETGLSCVSKIYECEFSRWDMVSDDLSRVGYSGYDDGWFRLPFSPVTAITTVTIGGVATTYDERGLKVKDIHPDTVIQTGTSGNTLAVTFTAGEASAGIKQALYRMVNNLFNHREDYSSASLSALSFDTQRLIANLSINTGF